MNLEVIASNDDLIDEGPEEPLTAFVIELPETPECHATEPPDRVLVCFLSIMTGCALTRLGKAG